ncbi:MAG: Fic family protein [Verrucomicrobiae bacterium]|nr:Fic family protein [Verrucomicrobiae bacterium]MCP5550011.1 Fic family protein [Akkermansiaceae bacterium]
MRLPKKPPDWQKILRSLSTDAQVDRILPARLSDDEYLPWDKLIYREPPAGFSREEWWLALKLNRMRASRQVSLIDKKGQPFRFFQTDSMSALLHRIDQGAGGALGMPEAITNETTRDYYYVSSLMNEAITSSQLEGAAVTREVAREMIRSGRKPRDQGERMILNNYLTMRHLEEWKNEPMSPELVFEIHRLITEDTLADPTAAGRFRRSDEVVEVVDETTEEVLHAPPAAEELPARLARFCDFANDTAEAPVFVHPVIRAILLHFWIGYDHPFVDGNGRTARALFYWLMLRNQYWLFQFVSISEILVAAPSQYARSYLLTETDDNDLNYFILYQIQTIDRAVKALHRFLERKTDEFAKASMLLRQIENLNHRQESLISRALKDSRTRFTIQSHRASHRVAYATARNDLLELVDLGLLTRMKRGRGFVFVAVPDLKRRLEGGTD